MNPCSLLPWEHFYTQVQDERFPYLGLGFFHFPGTLPYLFVGCHGHFHASLPTSGITGTFQTYVWVPRDISRSVFDSDISITVLCWSSQGHLQICVIFVRHISIPVFGLPGIFHSCVWFHRDISIQLVEQQCGRYLTMYSTCLNQFPDTWHLDCQRQKLKLAKCAESE